MSFTYCSNPLANNSIKDVVTLKINKQANKQINLWTPNMIAKECLCENYTKLLVLESSGVVYQNTLLIIYSKVIADY